MIFFMKLVIVFIKSTDINSKMKLFLKLQQQNSQFKHHSCLFRRYKLMNFFFKTESISLSSNKSIGLSMDIDLKLVRIFFLMKNAIPVQKFLSFNLSLFVHWIETWIEYPEQPEKSGVFISWRTLKKIAKQSVRSIQYFITSSRSICRFIQLHWGLFLSMVGWHEDYW